MRGLLWITGWLWVPEPRAARRMALQVADIHPNERLLELGNGATLVRLDPGSAVLTDGDGCAALTPVDLAAARPDPFCRMEDHWLSHLEEAHPEVLIALARHLPPELGHCQGARVRPLGVDRCGLRLRVETPHRDHDVRLAFPAASTPRSCGSRSTNWWDARREAHRVHRRAVAGGVSPSPAPPGLAHPARDLRSATNETNGIVPASGPPPRRSGRQRQRSARISVHTM